MAPRTRMARACGSTFLALGVLRRPRSRLSCSATQSKQRARGRNQTPSIAVFSQLLLYLAAKPCGWIASAESPNTQV